MNRFYPTESETELLIKESKNKNQSVDLSFGPSGVWIEWYKGTNEPWTVTLLKSLRENSLAGCDGDGI